MGFAKNDIFDYERRTPNIRVLPYSEFLINQIE